MEEDGHREGADEVVGTRRDSGSPLSACAVGSRLHHCMLTWLVGHRDAVVPNRRPCAVATLVVALPHRAAFRSRLWDKPLAYIFAVRRKPNRKTTLRLYSLCERLHA